jgi:rubredoxin
MPFCASCGAHFSEDECREDTRGHTEVAGGLAWSHIEHVYYCRDCARSRDRTSRLLIVIFGLFLVVVLGCAGVEILGPLFSR